jgi:hypothetical protein
MAESGSMWLSGLEVCRRLGINPRAVPTVALVNAIRVKVVAGSRLLYHAGDVDALAERYSSRMRLQGVAG